MLEHHQKGRVALEQLALRADARDPDRRALEDRAMVCLTALQRNRRFRAVDELADLGSSHREHRHDPAVDVSRPPRKQHQQAADRAPDGHRAGDLDREAGPPRGLADQRLARRRHLFVHGRHPRLDGPAHQTAVRWQRQGMGGTVVKRYRLYEKSLR